MATDQRVLAARRLTRRLAATRVRQDTLAAQRRAVVAELLNDGWSMQRLADALGVSKAAVQKMAR